MVENDYDSILEGLTLEGAEWEKFKGLVLSPSLRCQLPNTRARWRKRMDREHKLGKFPVYLNESRATIIVEGFIEVPAAIPDHVWAQRGVAVILHTASIL